jgi:hypothetical protein
MLNSRTVHGKLDVIFSRERNEMKSSEIMPRLRNPDMLWGERGGEGVKRSVLQTRSRNCNLSLNEYGSKISLFTIYSILKTLFDREVKFKYKKLPRRCLTTAMWSIFEELFSLAECWVWPPSCDNKLNVVYLFRLPWLAWENRLLYFYLVLVNQTRLCELWISDQSNMFASTGCDEFLTC